MNKKTIGLLLVAVIILMQLIPSGRPDVVADNANDLLLNNTVSDSISDMLRNSCYDCHSNETVYPWYAYVAPVSWLVSRDVREGRHHLNFSNWESLSDDDKIELLDDMGDEVGEGEMPMIIYPLTHPKAKLSEDDRAAFVGWAEDFALQIYRK